MLNETFIILITLTAGFIGSMLGMGGGFLIVPLLVLILKLPMHKAVVISLASVSGVTFSAFLTFFRNKLINIKLGILLETFTVLRALLGSYLASHLDERFLEVIFGLTCIYVSFRIVRSVEHREYRIFKSKKFFFASLGSFLAGLIASMIGIGGGVLKVPIMTLILGTPIKLAIGTSEFMIMITSFVATLNYHLEGMGKFYYELFGVVGGFCGAQLGSKVSLKLDSVFLKRFFALVLFCFSVAMIIKGILVL